MNQTTIPTLLTVLLLSSAACTVSDRFEDETPADKEAGDADSGVDESSNGDESAALGSPCETDRQCPTDFVCDQEIPLVTMVSGLPNGVPDLPEALFPGGSCTPVRAGAYDPMGGASCDPLLPPGQQGCGSSGVCTSVSIDGMSQVACRAACTPRTDSSGCARSGYTCQFETGACVEGCQSDEACRLRIADSDGDGNVDSLEYDEGSEARCDVNTFRCVHSGSGLVEAGELCERVDDCEDDGLCISNLQTFSGLPFPGGYCTRTGCDVEGRECTGEDAVCGAVRSWSGGLSATKACMRGCRVGAESEELQLGEDGHGEGCRDGYRCHYNGGPGASAGICVGGNYNAISDPNLGAACEADSECFSPFGHGVCMTIVVGSVQSPTGSCSVLDCAVPGLPEDICGDDGQCIGLSGDLSTCVRSCDEAGDCAPGFACADDDRDPSTKKICYPACFEDEDCRKGSEVCAVSADSTAGQCVASGA